MKVQVASDLLELADLCGGNKKQFADIADFILNRLLLINEGNGVQRLRMSNEFRPYILQLQQAGNQLQPLSREDAYQALLPFCKSPFLVDRLFGCDGVADSKSRTKKLSNHSYDTDLNLNHERIK